MTLATLTTLCCTACLVPKGFKMSTVARPPVNEVVISISFVPQPALVGPRLMLGLSSIVGEFPHVTEVQPYEMAEERPFEEQILQPRVPQIKFMGGSEVAHRYWLTNPESSAILLQVQNGYFALNWRRQEGNDAYYPGYENLIDLFVQYLNSFQEAILKQAGSPLDITQVELSYINILRPDGIWGTARDIRKVVEVQLPHSGNVEQVNVAYSEPVRDDADAFYGRTHAAISTGYQPKTQIAELRPMGIKDMTPVINISITTRSTHISETVATVGDRFSVAHDSLISTFKSLTTEAARANWGLS